MHKILIFAREANDRLVSECSEINELESTTPAKTSVVMVSSVEPSMSESSPPESSSVVVVNHSTVTKPGSETRPSCSVIARAVMVVVMSSTEAASHIFTY